MSARKLARTALLSAAALAVYIIEAQIPPLTTVPGIKLGLSNVITLFAMYSVGIGPALAVMAVKVLMGALITGQISSIIYSGAGGILSFAVCALLKGLLPQRFLWVISAFGAIAHNVGQIGAAVLVTGTPEIVWYLPVLVIAGVVTGVFTGVLAQLALGRLN